MFFLKIISDPASGNVTRGWQGRKVKERTENNEDWGKDKGGTEFKMTEDGDWSCN